MVVKINECKSSQLRRSKNILGFLCSIFTKFKAYGHVKNKPIYCTVNISVTPYDMVLWS